MTLAEALGLLLPSKSAEYKPSLFKNLLRGLVTEHYNDIKSDLLPQYSIPKTDHRKKLGGLMEDLQAAVGTPATKVTTKNLKYNLKSISDEDELLDLLRLSYYKNELSPQLLTQLLLNKHLRDLSRLPFDVENLDREAFRKNGWVSQNFVQFQILLLKKYYDLKKPLLIIKMLNEHFSSAFLPLIRNGQLLPFYERIVWKFCFEYLDAYEEQQIIEELNCLRSSVLIWEASLDKNRLVSEKILEFHRLPPLPKLFFELAACDPLQQLISDEIASGRSPTLSELKKLSSKSKLHQFNNMNTVIERALAYSLIHSLDKFLAVKAAGENAPEVYKSLMTRLAHERTNMIEQSETLEFVHDDKVLAN